MIKPALSKQIHNLEDQLLKSTEDFKSGERGPLVTAVSLSVSFAEKG